MRITLVPSAVGDGQGAELQFSTSYLVNDTVAIDAGPLGFWATPDDQGRVRHVFISHTHIDHIASLPIFVENAYEQGPACATIHGTEPVLDCLRRDVFNDRVWPDFLALSTPADAFIRLALLEPGRPVEVEGLRITPVAVDHVVPTTGFIVEDGQGAVVISSDTGPTQEIWDRANRTRNVKAVFLEVTFPNAMAGLARASKHLTPADFGAEARKLRHAAPVIAVHVKARFRAQVVNELHALGLPSLQIGRFGHPYHF